MSTYSEWIDLRDGREDDLVAEAVVHMNGDSPTTPALRLTVTPAATFASVDEPGAEALAGTKGDVLIPAGGDVLGYGDGGAGKTTLFIDCGCHLAAGDDWLGVPVPTAVRVLLIENEGPRPLLRQKLKRKLDAWTGSPIGDRLQVVEAPWAKVSFADPACRDALAQVIHDTETDVVIAGPVTRSGMTNAGTLAEVAEFMQLVAAVRIASQRPVTFVLIHHANKAGTVSGAWEGSGDTLLHVSNQGNGRTRLHIEKARWSPTRHATTLNLLWQPGEAFEVDQTPELTDNDIADHLCEYITKNPGSGWTAIERATPGTSKQRRANVREGLFASGTIINVAKLGGQETIVHETINGKPSRLYLATDPTIQHLPHSAGRSREGTSPTSGNGENLDLPAPPPLKGRGREGRLGRPSPPTLLQSSEEEQA